MYQRQSSQIQAKNVCQLTKETTPPERPPRAINCPSSSSSRLLLDWANRSKEMKLMNCCILRALNEFAFPPFSCPLGHKVDRRVIDDDNVCLGETAAAVFGPFSHKTWHC